MQSRIVPSVLATSLAVFIALPGVADAAGMTDSVRPMPALEHTYLLLRLTLVGPAVAIGVLTILGLTIGFPALRRDMRQRRGVSRRQGRRDLPPSR